MRYLFSVLVLLVLLGCDPVVLSYPTPAMEPTLPVGSKIIAAFGEVERNDLVVYRPPFNLEIRYLFRLVAMPGDTLHVQNGDVFVNGENYLESLPVNHSYIINATQSLKDRFFENYGISEFMRDHNNDYRVFCTDSIAKELERSENITSVFSMKMKPGDREPMHHWEREAWNRDNFGPVVIPKEGMKIRLNEKHMMLYGDVFDQEGGASGSFHTFQKDYFFVMGDNRHNAEDSRYTGFIPWENISCKATKLW